MDEDDAEVVHIAKSSETAFDQLKNIFSVSLDLEEKKDTKRVLSIIPTSSSDVDKKEVWDVSQNNGFPDLHELFRFYDDAYFFSTLGGVEVRWSPRMTLCAGLCVYDKGEYCSIRLSEPLLKFRSIQEYKETLLHEMIHAYLFVTKSRRDRESHGPEFQSHMRRINARTGFNVTIYHSFNDAVDYYRRHIWRCNGVCRFRPPWYGYLKRSMNRSPGPTDFWWAEHQTTCGGIYEKISEPIKNPKPRRRITTSRSNQCDQVMVHRQDAAAPRDSIVLAEARQLLPSVTNATVQKRAANELQTLEAFLSRSFKKKFP